MVGAVTRHVILKIIYKWKKNNNEFNGSLYKSSNIADRDKNLCILFLNSYVQQDFIHDVLCPMVEVGEGDANKFNKEGEGSG